MDDNSAGVGVSRHDLETGSWTRTGETQTITASFKCHNGDCQREIPHSIQKFTGNLQIEAIGKGSCKDTSASAWASALHAIQRISMEPNVRRTMLPHFRPREEQIKGLCELLNFQWDVEPKSQKISRWIGHVLPSSVNS